MYNKLTIYYNNGTPRPLKNLRVTLAVLSKSFFSSFSIVPDSKNLDIYSKQLTSGISLNRFAQALCLGISFPAATSTGSRVQGILTDKETAPQSVDGTDVTTEEYPTNEKIE